LKADEAHYLTNHQRIDQRGQRADRVLPPPDLAIEVELTAPLLDKIGICAAIRVVEIWHIHLSTGRPVVRILSLVDGAYVDHDASPAVP
jgi:Uma2 family endonuclease